MGVTLLQGHKVGSKPEGPGEKGATGYRPKILLLRRAKMVLCPFHRSHREICTQNRPVSETKFLDDFWGAPSSPGPFSLLLTSPEGPKMKKIRDFEREFRASHPLRPYFFVVVEIEISSEIKISIEIENFERDLFF